MKMKILWQIIFIAVTFGTIKCQEDTKLLLTQIMFRHGDRSPVKLYSSDPNPESAWPEGLGKLTLLGKKQQYYLGKFLRMFYANFVTSNPNEVTVNSSATDRCLRSAEATMAAFYAPTPEWSFEPCINWQPIPVHYIPIEKDKYLYPINNCPAFLAEAENRMESKQFKDFMAEHVEMLKYLSEQSGEALNDLRSIILLMDTLYIERRHNLTIPFWALMYWEQYENFIDRAFDSLVDSPLLLRLRIGPILGKIIEDMNKKVAGEIPNIKVRVYSTHDLQIFAVLKALGLPDVKRPPYSATLMFELHEKRSGEKAIRLIYLNSTTPENVFQKPHILTLEGCTEFCPLDYLVESTKHLIPENWEMACEMDGPQTPDTPCSSNLEVDGNHYTTKTTTEYFVSEMNGSVLETSE